MSTRPKRLMRAAIPEPGPLRTLTKATLANTVGNGLYYTVEVIFFTRSVGLSVHRVALGLGVAAIAGLLVSVPAGHLSDRWDPRFIVAAGAAGEGVIMGCFTLVHSFVAFLLLNIVGGVCGGSSGASRSVLLGRFGQGEDRVRIRAYQRAVTNLGMSVGIALSGVGLALDTRSAYVAMVLGNAVTFFAAAAYVLRLPVMAPLPLLEGQRREPMTVVLRDRRYLLASLLNGLFAIHFIIQSVGLPLWIVYHTRAPRWWVSVLLIINTMMVITLQVRTSRGSGDVVRAAQTFLRSGVMVAVACVLYSFAAGVDPVVACVVLVLAMVAHTLGELYSSGASWGIGYGLARQDLQGQYQGAFSLGWGISGVIGPSIVAATAISLGRVGWFILAGGFLVVGAAFRPLVASYERSATRDRSSLSDP
ncbi:MAG TPA: MFS transporter [Acidimicrobiales bacterium]